MAQSTPDTVTPAIYEPKASAPIANPITIGDTIVIIPGSIISFNAALVDISTHLSYSGSALPSIIPGISLNCLRTSLTIAIAAFPTELIAKAENTTGIIPPINKAARTFALKILIPSISVKVTYAAKRARAVSAAEAIANPFPTAAVVLPTASNISVLSLTSGSSSDISAIPPALSAIGPNASIANCMAVVAIIADAPIATP